MPGTACLTPAQRGALLRLQRQALQYFLDNQLPGGLILDRQSNHGPRRAHGLLSTSATGMGLIALALASAPPYRLLPPSSAAARVGAAVETALLRLPHDHGVMPHFLDSATGAVHGGDRLSTIDSAWLIAGALWAAEFLQQGRLRHLAEALFARVDWRHWTAPNLSNSPGLLRHGQDQAGRFLACCWDRLNGETVFMYVLAAGAAEGRAMPAAAWQGLRPFHGTVAGLHFNNADLGLFVFQYGLDLLDLRDRPLPLGIDLHAEARVAAEANRRACREAATVNTTYRRYWGVSAGDGPDGPPHGYAYRCYAPGGPLDGTAHLTAALASVAHVPDAVLENLAEAERDGTLAPWGRYGLSSVNAERDWVARDMVGIDAGAAVLALDNYLMADRVRRVFHRLPCVEWGLRRLGLPCTVTPAAHRAS
jgi:hypothetical protein